MLLFTILAIGILSYTAYLHYKQHFISKKCCCSLPKRSSFNADNNHQDQDTDTQISIAQMKLTRKNRKSAFHFCKLTKVDEEFNFFPTSFLFYLQFKILLCILIIIVEILNFSYNTESVIDLLFGYSIKSYQKNSLTQLHLHHNFKTDKLYGFIVILDHILIYGIMISNLWESLFSFFRYYSTVWSTTNNTIISTKKVVKKFVIYYGIIFCILFLMEIHVWWTLFPVVVILHFVFNFFCTFKFASILTDKYKYFIEMDSKAEYNLTINTFNHDILKAVYFTKYTSLICCVLESIYIGLLVITYNVNIIYCMPLIWSISCSIYSLTFIRNRNAFKRKLRKYCRVLKHRKKCKKCHICCCNKSKNEITLKTKLSSENLQVDIDPQPEQARSLAIQQNISQSDFVLYSGLRNNNIKSNPNIASSKYKALDLLGLSPKTNDEPSHTHQNPKEKAEIKSETNKIAKLVKKISVPKLSKQSSDSALKIGLTNNISIKSDPGYNNLSDDDIKISTHQSYNNKISVKDDIKQNDELAFATNEYDINEEKEINMNENNDINIEENKMDIVDIVENGSNMDDLFFNSNDMFSMLAKHGLCSRQSVNSIQQLNKYRLQQFAKHNAALDLSE